jgi:predicted enzyme related to lactoylglutathione lyase
MIGFQRKDAKTQRRKDAKTQKGDGKRGCSVVKRFCRYELRTTDVAAGRVFYAAVLGEGELDVVPLPEAAAARGAPAHWLGHLGVEDVEGAARALAERGGTRLGPTRPGAGGGEVAIVRDPGGAVVAVATGAAATAWPEVVWHQLNTTALASVMASYGALFGWAFGETLDLGEHGIHHRFAWRAGGANVGSMADVAGRAGVHPHWLFHFRVTDIERALAAVRAGGGLVVGPVVEVGGHRIAVCDDPQGAAFALRERGS